jgi:membrane protease YdiL (CAAX protease family)
MGTAPHDRSPKKRPPLENVGRYRHPLAFYVLATAIPWVLWFTAAWFSHRPDTSTTTTAVITGLGLAGLVAPAGVAIWFIRRDGLGRDVLTRLVAPPGTHAWIWLAALALLPASVLVATAISVVFGYDTSQFELRNGFSFATGLMPAWITLALAPVLEELAWHTYGTDALAARMSVLWTSLLFGVVWVLWHVPLGFIKGYYQAEVVEEGLIHSINYAVSLVPFVILMNWLYYRAGRSVLVAIVFHLTANFGNELFLTHPDTKVIQTGLLLALSVAVVWHDRDLFLTPPGRRHRSGPRQSGHGPIAATIGR